MGRPRGYRSAGASGGGVHAVDAVVELGCEVVVTGSPHVAAPIDAEIVVDVAGNPTETGLRFPSNLEREAEDVRLRFLGPACPPNYPTTIIWRVCQHYHPTYWVNFFWAHWEAPFGGAAEFNWGCHPWPNWAEGGTPYWEIATEGGDNVTAAVVFDVWQTQVARATQDGTNVVLEYWPEWPSAASKVTVIITKAYADTLPAVPALTWGDSPWWSAYGHERTYGTIRGFQIYAASLSEADIAAELVAPKSTAAGSAGIWYLKINPSPEDTADESGAGHDPEWADVASKATLWQTGEAP